MQTDRNRTAEGFADLIQVRRLPNHEGEIGLALATPTDDDVMWRAHMLVGGWQGDAQGRWFGILYSEAETPIGAEVGTSDWDAEFLSRLDRYPYGYVGRFDATLHAFGRRERLLPDPEQDVVGMDLRAWLRRPATEEERDLVAARTLHLASAFDEGRILLDREVLGIFDVATELDVSAIEIVTGTGVADVRAACAAFPMLAAEIAASEQVADGLLDRTTIAEALEAGALGDPSALEREPLPPLKPHTVAWLKDLRLRSTWWTPSEAPAALALANDVVPELLPRTDGEFEILVRIAVNMASLAAPDADPTDEIIYTGSVWLRLLDRFSIRRREGRGRWSPAEVYAAVVSRKRRGAL